MAHQFFRIRSFLSYWLGAVDEHSLHSPFFFDLYTKQIKPSAPSPEFARIESMRAKLLSDERTISVLDLGSGGAGNTSRKISDMARKSLSSPRYSLIYHRLARSLKSSCIVELGTSFGINTLYLAAVPNASVTTFEGSPAIADIAALTFEFAASKNIELIVGNIDKTLPHFLQRIRKVDLVFIDANHRYDPTVQYFEWIVRHAHESTVIIIDDIYHSPEMARAWKEVKGHRLVYGSADLFRCGILFFDPSLNKQHVILQI